LNPVDDKKDKLSIDGVESIEAKREYVEPINTNIQDPIITMFKNVKKNIDLKFPIYIDNKIPRLDFIEMMEDSYEVSIIDFLADEFTNKILSDPSKIRETIKEKINELVYGVKNSQLDDKVVDFKSLSARERVKAVSEMSIDELNGVLKTETAKTVITAANKRLDQLK